MSDYLNASESNYSGSSDGSVANYSSIGRRMVAVFLDTLILVIPCWIGGHIVPFLGAVLVAFLYAPVFESSEVRATLGKHLMGIQVTDLSGRRISFRAAVLRYLMKIVSSLIFFLGHAFALFTARKQALHDLVAETVVVYGRSPRAPVDAWIEQLKGLFRSGEAKLSPNSSQLSKLERLQALREKGALTEEEFQVEKKRIMGLP